MLLRGLTLLVLGLALAGWAQDGIYGSFIVGQKFIDLKPLNDQLDQLGYDLGDKPFPNNSLTLGGEGHLILAKRLVLGGKAFGISHERVVAGSSPETRFRVTGGSGMGVVGLNLTGENRFGIHLYPQVGVGVSSFILQKKVAFANAADMNFDNLVSNNDNMTTLGKFGLLVDLGAGFDWYKPFKNFFTIIPGLDVGLMLHAEAGYSLLPMNFKWRRDIDLGGKDQVEGGPDLKFNAFYFNVGLGLGLSPKD
jgi:hypothetical protein